jgi:DNA (cytosine-5)-methyltransferase 1
VLSSNGGRDFGTFLGMLGELGYGFAYRILDAQYFGVPQRRRRVFVVGYLGDWRRAAAVLFESESLRGDTPPSRKTGKSVTGTTKRRITGGFDYEMNPHGPDEPTGTLLKGSPTGGGRPLPAVCYDMRGRGDGDTMPTLCTDHPSRPSDFCPVVMSTGQGNAEITEGHAPTLNCNHEAPILALAGNTIGREPENGGNGCGYQEDLSYTLTKTDEHGVMQGSTVRRLTPVECERLQGFPDNWTRIPWRGATAENCPDGPRYKACGNSMAVPGMRWIGERISKYE